MGELRELWQSVRPRRQRAWDREDKIISEIFADLTGVVREALIDNGLDELLPHDFNYSGSLRSYSRQLPNQHRLKLQDGIFPPPVDPPYRDIPRAAITLTLQEPYEAEEISVHNVIILNGQPSEPPQNGPGDIWAYHDTLGQLRESLSMEIGLALHEPERLYGAYALGLFEDRSLAAA